MSVLLISILSVAIHLAWAGNRILDLFKRSKRKNKTQWVLFILLLPVVGALTYNFTMRRQKLARKPIVF